MRKKFLLARLHLRKSRGQMIAIAMLMLLAAAMLNLWLMLSMDYKQNFDRIHNRLKAEHVTLAVDGDSPQLQGFLRETLEKDKRTDGFSLEPSLHMAGVFAHRGGEINAEFVFLEKQAALSRSIGRVEILEDSHFQSGIYMPILYKSDQTAIGKEITISIGGKKAVYTVCGFFNSVMSGSHNCFMCQVILTEDKYRELEEAGYAQKSTLCSVRLKDKTESEGYETMLKNTVSAQYPGLRSVSNSYALVSQSRYISQMVCSGIISAMAFFVLVIALVVTGANITHYIQENMRNLGTLKAIGYTSRQLMASIRMQFLGITLLAALVGAGFSYCLFPYLNDMMVSQTGIPYNIHFLPFPLLFMALILSGAVVFTVWLSSRRIRRTEPVVALRQGLQTHNFKGNHFPLETAKMPLSFALALKAACSNIRHNLTICITMLALSLVVVFSGVMVENIIMDMTPFLNMIVGEIADSCININASMEEEFQQELEQDSRVEKLYLYHSIEVRHVGGLSLMATVCDDFSKANNQDVVWKGRFPKFENEIVVAAKYAKEQGLELGDAIVLTANGQKAPYLISGFTQISNNLGKDCLMVRSGYERLGSLPNVSYYLNLTDGTDIEAFHSEIKGRFANGVNATINIKATVDGAGSIYVSLMAAIVAAILLLSIIIITFVLYLLVRNMLGNKRQEYGILKALGFTSRQLILQVSLSFLPAVLLSTLVGLVICCFVINPLTAFFLNSIGIVKCTFTVPIGLIAVGGAGLVLLAFGITCLLSFKIKKISPKVLLTGE